MLLQIFSSPAELAAYGVVAALTLIFCYFFFNIPTMSEMDENEKNMSDFIIHGDHVVNKLNPNFSLDFVDHENNAFHLVTNPAHNMEETELKAFKTMVPGVKKVECRTNDVLYVEKTSASSLWEVKERVIKFLFLYFHTGYHQKD